MFIAGRQKAHEEEECGIPLLITVVRMIKHKTDFFSEHDMQIINSQVQDELGS